MTYKKITLIIVISLALLSTLIYIAFNIASVKHSSGSSASLEQSKGQTSTSQTNFNQIAYLDIPEINVKIQLPDDLKDLKYYVDRQSVEGTTFIQLTTSNLMTLDGNNTRCTAKNAAIGAIWKLDADPKQIGANVNEQKYLNPDYVVYEGPQAPCSARSNVAELQQMQVESLKSAFNSISVLKELQ